MPPGCGIISHDILSNLDLILSTGNILVGQKPKAIQLSQYYDLSQSTSHQLKKYCLNLLEEARLNQERSDKQDHDPKLILEAVFKRFETLLQQKNVALHLEYLAPSILPPVLVEQCFQNLISNALRYACDGPSPMLRFCTERDESGRASWIMEDNGPGITEEICQSIRSASPVKSSKGQGLGLSQLSASLQEYGAELSVKPRPGGGTRFIIALP